MFEDPHKVKTSKPRFKTHNKRLRAKKRQRHLVLYEPFETNFNARKTYFINPFKLIKTVLILQSREDNYFLSGTVKSRAKGF